MRRGNLQKSIVLGPAAKMMNLFDLPSLYMVVVFCQHFVSYYSCLESSCQMMNSQFVSQNSRVLLAISVLDGGRMCSPFWFLYHSFLISFYCPHNVI